MKYILLLITAFVGALVWAVVTRLDTDALALMAGLLLGICSGIPTALLVLAAGRQGREEADARGAPADAYRRRMEIREIPTPFGRNGDRAETMYLSGEVDE